MPDPTTFPETGGGFGDLQSLINIFQQLFGGGGTNTQGESQSPEALAAAQSMMGLLGPEFTNGQFSPEQADRDSAGQVQAIIRQMTESGMPGIQTGENSAGAYNSTAAQLLRNDLATRTAEAGAARVATTRTQYASARQSQINSMIALITAMSNAHRTNSTNSATNALLNAQNTRNAARAAAAAAALRALTGGGKPSGKPPSNKPTKVPQQRETTNPNEPDTSAQDDMDHAGNGLPEDINRDDVLGLDLTGADLVDDTSQIDDFDHGGAISEVTNTGNTDVIDLGDLGGLNPETFQFDPILDPNIDPNSGGNTGNNNNGTPGDGLGPDGTDLGDGLGPDDYINLGDDTDFTDLIDYGDGGGGSFGDGGFEPGE